MHTSVLVADEGDVYELLDQFAAYDGDPDCEDARWDNFGVGGNFAGALPLLRRRAWRRMLPFLPRWLTGASVARKSEVDKSAFLQDPPAALFFRGILYECPLTDEPEGMAEWVATFCKLFDEIPEGTTLQIVDAHS